MRKDMSRVVKICFSYFDDIIDIGDETNKLIGDERFDQCVYFKDDNVMGA
jgi:hypothetical protein